MSIPRGAVMARREWAEKKLATLVKDDWASSFRGKYIRALATFIRSLRNIQPEDRRVMLLRMCDVLSESRRKEHARAVRIIKKRKKAAYFDKDSMSADQFDAYLEALNDVLTALTKGRA